MSAQHRYVKLPNIEPFRTALTRCVTRTEHVCQNQESRVKAVAKFQTQLYLGFTEHNIHRLDWYLGQKVALRLEDATMGNSMKDVPSQVNVEQSSEGKKEHEQMKK